MDQSRAAAVEIKKMSQFENSNVHTDVCVDIHSWTLGLLEFSNCAQEVIQKARSPRRIAVSILNAMGRVMPQTLPSTRTGTRTHPRRSGVGAEKKSKAKANS